MFRLWPAVALVAVGCGRIGFDDAGPSLDLDFTRSEVGSVELTRSSPASYFDATGVLLFAGPDQPRFDHHPLTRAPRGLLVESQRTNLLIDSAALDVDTKWFTTGVTLVEENQAIAPDGTLSADAIIDQDTSSSRRGQGARVADDDLPYTYSIYARAGTTPTFSFSAELLDGTQQVQTSMRVNLVAGTIAAPPVGADAFGIEPYPDGWFRVWITLTNTGTGNVEGVLNIWGDLDDRPQMGSVLVWGAQVEQSAWPTSYIATGATIATRAADVAVERELSWLAHGPGTLRVRSSLDRDIAQPLPAACFVGTSTPDCALHTTRGVVTATIAVEAATDVDRLGVGTNGIELLDGHIERVTYWPRQLSEAELRLRP